MTLQVGSSREIVIGEVLALHIKSNLVNERLHVDAKGLNAPGRMGGHRCVRTDETFDLPTMSLDELDCRDQLRRRSSPCRSQAWRRRSLPIELSSAGSA
ncbi:hypothetical protein [Rhizobium sp. ICMP 5592]|uniref:hypothetical protein n=1 Tax=Rhizobium sp. ICMP 5592 TaxID=2292445 RepID=UPI0025701246|nr:hypothetical protein [Rhizobium sp. ICMP 5592]